MSKVFIHGVPDTPVMWEGLVSALGLGDQDYIAPALPGFEAPAPSGFSSTKEAYSDWLISQVEAEVQRTGGPVDVVGHDWGALLTLRICSLRPDLFKSFAVANALIDPVYRGHRMARLWATPVVGELMMFLSRTQNFANGLKEAGMPEELAVKEVAYWEKPMRQSILSLYRSAKGLRFSEEWLEGLKNLPPKGMVLWGEHDPFVDLSVAKRFTEQWNYPLHVFENKGHWGIIEEPHVTAGILKTFWNEA